MARFDPPSQIDVPAEQELEVSNVDAPVGTIFAKTENGLELTAVRSLYMIPRGEIFKTETGALTAEDLACTVINNYGQGADSTLTLPTAAANMSCLVVIGATGHALHVKAGTNDKIYLDGSTLDDADKVSLISPAIGDYAWFITFKTGANSWDWLCNAVVGAWIDGGA